MTTLTRAGVKEMLHQARRKNERPDFNGAELSDIDLNRLDLSGADFGAAILKAANLIEANLRASNLSRANLDRVDLIGADLPQANLSGVSLVGANLIGANLAAADLAGANLSGADLSGANLERATLPRAALSGADFIGANLMKTDFSQADLSGVDLSGATLIEADLREADLSSARLIEADLSRAIFGSTRLLDIDLRQTHGLAATVHAGPSALDIRTLYRSRGLLPKSFLTGLGAPDALLTHAAALPKEAPAYYACFIGYASPDERFAQKLYRDLQAQGVRCWYAPEDSKRGNPSLPTTGASIRGQDKLLLIFSEAALATAWPAQEVEAALQRERRLDEIVLFPLRLDGALLASTAAWAKPLQNGRNIHNFSMWHTESAYQRSLDRLLRHLKARHR